MIHGLRLDDPRPPAPRHLPPFTCCCSDVRTLSSVRRALVPALLALGATLPARVVPAQGAAPRATEAADPLAVSTAELAGRRAALAARIGDSAAVIVALGAPEPTTDYVSFWQAPSFLWLTGFREPDAALVMLKRGAALEATLFVQPSDPAREVWTGARAGVVGARTLTGITARPAAQLRSVLDSLAGAGLPMAIVGDLRGGETQTADEQLIARLARAHPGLRVIPATRLVEQLRGRKSTAELARIRRAAEVTVQAQREAMRLIEPGLNEFEAQALIEYTFRRLGADRPSFATIVGSGPNATTLHYNADDRPMRAGELVVLDVGASYAGYAADVTRTLPVSGRFTAEQRALYQVVRDAQAAAERVSAPGASWLAVQDSARVTLARGLARLGLIEAADATYECGPAIAGSPPRQCAQVGLYYLHGLGHGIGLEVHDPTQFYVDGVMRPGDAFTLEPGAYVRERLLALIPETPRNATFKARIADAVRRYANAGVRIEDDYLVGERGVEWVSRAPREADEVEAAMREPWRGPAPRDARAVDAYRPR